MEIEKYKQRESGVELLKIFAILLIITNHVVQTLCEPNGYITYSDYLMDISHATRDAKQLILAMLRYSGVFGNTLFFVCSAWFLVDKQISNKRKICYMIADVWIFSIAFLGIALITNHGHVAVKLMIKELFPTTFANNWYITCYILFLLLYPWLNTIISKMTQPELFRSSILLALLYIVVNFIKDRMFFTSALILWVAIYFVVSYIKFFMCSFSDNLKANVILALVGLVGNYGIIFLTNALGLKISFFSDKVLYWDKNCSPFLIMAAIGLFNIVRRPGWKNKWINGISKCSLLIYIIHENLLVRTYYRPALWQYIYVRFEGGEYNHVLLWTFVQVLLIFVISLLISLLYKKFIQKYIHIICDKIVDKATVLYNRLEMRLLKIK